MHFAVGYILINSSKKRQAGMSDMPWCHGLILSILNFEFSSSCNDYSPRISFSRGKSE